MTQLTLASPGRARLQTATVLAAAVLALGACGLPRSGPNKNEIYAGAVERGGDTHIIYVNNHVNRTANFMPAYGFSSDFINAAQVGAEQQGAPQRMNPTVLGNERTAERQKNVTATAVCDRASA